MLITTTVFHYDERRIFTVAGIATQQRSSFDEVYLDKVGLKYSTYTYWNRKFRFSPSADDDVPFAQVSLRTSSDATLPVHTGNITLQFPNGVRVCLESGWKKRSIRQTARCNSCQLRKEYLSLL